jgi:hypothetical protein
MNEPREIEFSRLRLQNEALASIVRTLCRQIQMYKPDSDLAKEAMSYLLSQGLCTPNTARGHDEQVQ